MVISIIVCTRDRANSLGETLSSLRGVATPDVATVELLVVDNGSTDNTREIVENFASGVSWKTHYVYEPRVGKSRALNAGLARASGGVILFTDDDVRFPRNWIEGVCGPILHGQADVVQGGIRWAPHLLGSSLGHSYLPGIITSTDHKTAGELNIGLIGANMAMTRTAYNAVGAFDEELGPGALGLGEETLLGLQLAQGGFRKALVAHVQVEHHFDSSRLNRKGILKLAERKGRSLAHIQYHWEHLEEKFLFLKGMVLSIKELIRTILTPAAWPGRQLIPEWKYSYHVEKCRLDQFKKEKSRPRKYSGKDSGSSIGPKWA